MSDIKPNVAPADTDPCFSPSSEVLGKPIIPMILSLIGVSLLAIIGLLLSTFQTLDRIALENLHQRVETALEVETRRQENTLQEYSFWDEGYAKLIEEPDVAWAEQNTGAYVFESYGTNLTLALRGDLSATMLWVDGEHRDQPEMAMQDKSLLELVEGLRASSKHVRSGYVIMAGQPYLASVGKFRDEDTEQARPDGAVLVFAKRLEKAFIESLAQIYRIKGLRVAGESEPADMLLSTAGAKPLLNVVWHKQTPSSQYIHALLVPIALVFSAMAFLTWLVLRRERSNRQNYVENLCEMASKDFLTGISNRREFFFLANREMTRAKRESRALSVLMMDLDFFKQINDGLGHDAGDGVLAGFASLVQENLRDFDIFARLGGEEFVVLLVGAGKDEARAIADRLCQLVAKHHFLPQRKTPVDCTVSIGVAVWNTEEALDKLLSRADDALYDAKENGRNQARLAEFS